MKKKLERGVRSKSVRDYLASNPGASPKTVVEDLKKTGVNVSLGLVSVIKYSKAARGGKKGKGTVDGLLHAKKFIDQVGGIEAAKEAIELIEKLR